MITADGFETAFVAVAFSYNGNDIAVYDYDLCIKVLIDRDDNVVYKKPTNLWSYNVVGVIRRRRNTTIYTYKNI